MKNIKVDNESYRFIERLPEVGEYFLDFEIFHEEDVDVRCFPEDKVVKVSFITGVWDEFGNNIDCSKVITDEGRVSNVAVCEK